MRRLLTVIFFTGLALAATAARQRTLSVQIREGQVRSAPGFLSRVVATVPYTERVSVLEERTDWMRVKTETGGVEGWMHTSALTSQKLTLSAGERDAQLAVSSDEQALAGKGFNSDVEAQFKARNSAVDFTWVDKMEAIRIPVETLQAFLSEGGVKPAEGGAR